MDPELQNILHFTSHLTLHFLSMKSLDCMPVFMVETKGKQYEGEETGLLLTYFRSLNISCTEMPH